MGVQRSRFLPPYQLFQFKTIEVLNADSIYEAMPACLNFPSTNDFFNTSIKKAMIRPTLTNVQNNGELEGYDITLQSSRSNNQLPSRKSIPKHASSPKYLVFQKQVTLSQLPNCIKSPNPLHKLQRISHSHTPPSTPRTTYHHHLSPHLQSPPQSIHPR